MAPTNAANHYLLACVLAVEKKDDAAFEHLQKSVALGLIEYCWKTGHGNPISQTAATGAFESIKRDSRFAAVMTASWDRLLVLAGSDPFALANLAIDALRTGESKRALDVLERAVNQGLDADAAVFKDPAWKPLKSDPCFQRLKRKAAEASCDAAAKAASLYPQSPYALYQWAKSLARLNRLEEAMEKIEQAVNLGLDPDMLILKDDTWESLKSDPRMPKLLRQAAEASCAAAARAAAANPKSSYASYKWARCLARLQKPRGSLAEACSSCGPRPQRGCIESDG